jgi:hypothetical protein
LLLSGTSPVQEGLIQKKGGMLGKHLAFFVSG